MDRVTYWNGNGVGTGVGTGVGGAVNVVGALVGCGVAMQLVWPGRG
jgi:hypothetical protein